MKRLIGFVLAAVMIFCLCPMAVAAGEADDAAEKLYSLGLFRGTGTDKAGNPTFALEREATRAEALVMLIRLLGKESEALACSDIHPFTDVPKWADRYVAYAYANGLTNGVSATRFGTTSYATANMYLTFVLRALGYTDSGDDPDFSYNKANKFALEIGLTDRDYTGQKYLRADAAADSLTALEQPLHGESVTLIESLVAAGAVDEAAAAALFAAKESLPEGSSITFEVDANGAYKEEQLTAVMPEAAGVLYGQGSWNPGDLTYLGVSDQEYALCRWLGYGTGLNVTFGKGGLFWTPSEGEYGFVVDDDMQILGYYTGNADGKSIMLTGWHYDLAALQSTCMQNVQAHIAAAGTLTVDNSVFYDEHINGSSLVRSFPIFLDGQPLPDGVYIDIATTTAKTVTDAEAEQWLRNRVNEELYTPILIDNGAGLERQLIMPWMSERLAVQPDGTTTVSLNCSKNIWNYMLITVFDSDLNVRGYGAFSYDPFVV